MMTTEELRDLFDHSKERSRELEAKYRSGFPMTRRECNEISECTRRLGVVCFELWVRAGKPPGFEHLFGGEVSH